MVCTYNFTQKFRFELSWSSRNEERTRNSSSGQQIITPREAYRFTILEYLANRLLNKGCQNHLCIIFEDSIIEDATFKLVAYASTNFERKGKTFATNIRHMHSLWSFNYHDTCLNSSSTMTRNSNLSSYENITKFVTKPHGTLFSHVNHNLSINPYPSFLSFSFLSFLILSIFFPFLLNS